MMRPCQDDRAVGFTTFDVNMVAKHEQDWVAYGQWVIQDGKGVHGILRFSGFVGWGGTFLGELRLTP